jgi:hypothetical protein
MDRHKPPIRSRCSDPDPAQPATTLFDCGHAHQPDEVQCAVCGALITEPACEPCVYFDGHGWIGRGRSHCRTCHAIWTGTAPAHCTKCHRTFGSNGTADLAHSSYRDASGELRRRCHAPELRGLIATTHRDGTVIWRRPAPPQAVLTTGTAPAPRNEAGGYPDTGDSGNGHALRLYACLCGAQLTTEPGVIRRCCLEADR